MLSSWLSIPSRVYRRFRGGAAARECIHEYYARRPDSEAQLRQEVRFAAACGGEYAENIVRELGAESGRRRIFRRCRCSNWAPESTSAPRWFAPCWARG